MGKEATLKMIRRQLRTVVKEQLDTVVSNQLVASVRLELAAKIDTGLVALNKVLNDKLNQIDERHKDVLNAYIRGMPVQSTETNNK